MQADPDLASLHPGYGLVVVVIRFTGLLEGMGATLPLSGGLLRKLETARFRHALGMLLRAFV